MKKILYFSFLAFAVMSCNKVNVSQNDFEDNMEFNQELSVRVAEVLTKAAPQGLVEATVLPDDAVIGLFMQEDNYELAPDTDPTAHGPVYNYDGIDYKNVQYSSSINSQSEQVWGTTSKVYLTSTLGNVYAYYPYHDDATYAGKTYNDMGAIPVYAENENQVDFMWATPHFGLHNRNYRAELEMNHALSVVRFVVKRGSYTGTGNISDLKIMGKGFETEATMNLFDGLLSFPNGTAVANNIDTELNPPLETGGLTLAFLQSGETEVVPQQSDIIVVPNYESDAIQFQLTIDDVVYDLESAAIELEPGKIAQYEFTINATELVITGVKVVDWVVVPSGSFDDVTGEDYSGNDDANGGWTPAP